MSKVNPHDRLNFPATLRNRVPIYDVLRKYIPDHGLVLEIASGSGEHGVFLQNLFPSIIWQTSDPELVHRKSIVSWISHEGLSSKMPKPLDINVKDRPWPVGNNIKSSIKGIVCINMIHISPWSCTKDLFEESKFLLKKNNFLMLYGPFFKKIVNSESNLNFDKLLKSRNPLWGIRHLHRVNEIALRNNFKLHKIIDMPSNNLSVIYRLN
tara:strand:+ start:1812 stop:2441 length:630 start_codon:yes stop_codon:yes gene_type:complete